MVINSANKLTPEPESRSELSSRAVLNALPDAIFVLDAHLGTLVPQNAAAGPGKTAAELESAILDFANVFPELDFVALRNSAVTYLHTLYRVPSAAGAADSAANPIDAVVQVYPLQENHRADSADSDQTTRSNGSASHLVMIVRPLMLPADRNGGDLAQRDALDDIFHDPLTRLPNRRLFERRLQRAIDRCSRSDYHCAVLFVDLDRFKEVNDRFGHLEGDKVLVAVAHRLVEAVRPQDMIARRDGDEFTILLDDLAHPDDAVGVAQRILEHLQVPLSIHGLEPTFEPKPIELSIQASIGIALVNGRDAALATDRLISRADAAMYHAKASGGGTYISLDRSADAAGLSRPQGKPLPR